MAFTEIPPVNVSVSKSRLDRFKLSGLQPREPDFGSDTYRVLTDVPVLFLDPATQWVWARLELSSPGDVSLPGGVSVRPAGYLPDAIRRAVDAQAKPAPMPNGDPGAIKAYLCMSVYPYFGYTRLFHADEDVRIVVQADINLIV